MPPRRRITHHRPSTWLLTFALLGLFAFSTAAEEKSTTETKSVQPSVSSLTPKDENIYIDDEGLEGSGGRGEIHDDLEKEPDYSGSGFGPDDEDSSSTHHSSTSHHSSTGSSGTSGTNTNLINNRPDSTNRKDTTRVTEYDSGSGDGDSDDEDDDINHEDDDDDDDNDHDNSRPLDYDHDDENEKNDDDKEHDDNEEIYTDITVPNKHHHDRIPDRSGETVNNKDISKTNNGIDLELEHSRNLPTGGTFVEGGSGVSIMNAKNDDRTASFFAQPGILAAVIGGAVVGLLCAILVVMFIVYRMRKKDEGSYALDEPKRSPAVNSYAKNANNREFYA